MSKENNGSISNLQNLINTEFENFERFETNIEGIVVNTFKHVPSDSLYFIGKECALMVGYEISNTPKAINNHVDEGMRTEIDNKSANALLNLMSNRGNDGNLLIYKASSNMDEANEILVNASNSLKSKENIGISPENNMPVGFISEYGLYSLLMKSTKKKAAQFQLNVFDIIKTIHRTGNYISANSNTNITPTLSSAKIEEFMKLQTEAMTIQSKSILSQTETIPKLIELIDNRNNLVEKITKVIFNVTGNPEYWQQNTACVVNKTAWPSRNWDKDTRLWEAVSDLVTYANTHSVNISDINTKLTKAIIKNEEVSAELAKTNTELAKTNTELAKTNTELTNLKQMFDDQLVANVEGLRREIANIKDRM